MRFDSPLRRTIAELCSDFRCHRMTRSRKSRSLPVTQTRLRSGPRCSVSAIFLGATGWTRKTGLWCSQARKQGERRRGTAKRYSDLVRAFPHLGGIRPDAPGTDQAGDRRRHPRPPDRGLDAAAVLPGAGREAWRGARHGGAGLPAAGRPGLPDRARTARPLRQPGSAGDTGQAAAEERRRGAGRDRLEGAAQGRGQRHAAPGQERELDQVLLPVRLRPVRPGAVSNRRMARMQPHGAGGAGDPQLGGRHDRSRRPAADRADPGAAAAAARHLRQSRRDHRHARRPARALHAGDAADGQGLQAGDGGSGLSRTRAAYSGWRAPKSTRRQWISPAS